MWISIYYQESERQPADGRKHPQITYSIRGLLSAYIKNSHNSTTERQIAQLKMGKCLEETFFQRSIQMTNKHMKICSTWLIRKMQIKPHWGTILTHPRCYNLNKTIKDRKQVLVKTSRSCNLHTLLVRM